MASIEPASATCLTCNTGVVTVWGNATDSLLKEASGIALSSHNPGVVWTHNDDGDDRRMFAFNTNGALLARFGTGLTLGDVEDMALGPGPVLDVSYLYLGDLGGKGQPNEVRDAVKIVRIPEPSVLLAWSSSPRQLNFNGVETFSLLYPDGSYESETLLLDPISGDLFVATKQHGGSRVYRANPNAATNNATLTMEFVALVPFASASGGSISADGSRIVLRDENSARIWFRCPGETVAIALSRAGQNIPVVGTPTEPNGEAIGFLPDGTGYVTISDSQTFPPIHCFPLTCVQATEITQQPQSVEVEPGADVQFSVQATGTNLTYQWRFQGSLIPGETSATLSLASVQPANTGAYTVLVSGDGGTVLSDPATLTVKIFPPVIVTQPQNTLAATGSTVRLSVGVQGTAPFNFFWTRGARQSVSTQPMLTLTNVQHLNAGRYRVAVSNSAGKVTSAFAQLKVLNPPVMAINPLQKTVTAGTRVILRARAKGSPPLRYQWLFNGAPVTGAVTPQLVLRGVQPTQGGNYSVIVTNAVGTVTSSAAELIVQ